MTVPRITSTGRGAYRLRTFQRLAMKPREAFSFFENPLNLSAITPPWLDFRIVSGRRRTTVREQAEFDYTIRWFGVTMPWRSRITEYRPGRLFTDTQVRGPYRSWVHRHLFRAIPGGTLVVDVVRFALPPAGRLFAPLIRRQLVDIFTYRSRRIEEWASRRPSV